jgi:UDP-2-acetamido-3-amino-2,3-dideoxy-glucuronate N-acetyltransferase
VNGLVHPTAIVEPGVEIGLGTHVWDNAHIRGPTRVGTDCTIGEKSYIAYGVVIGDRVKINAFVYICAGVTIEDGVMVSAGSVFTNDRYPRATMADLAILRPSEPDEHMQRTLVREGATIGARTVIGCDLTVGRWSMVGMGSVVTRSVPDYHLVVGQPARPVACVCRCGEPFLRFDRGAPADTDAITCPACRLRYSVLGGTVVELEPEPQQVVQVAATDRRIAR